MAGEVMSQGFPISVQQSWMFCSIYVLKVKKHGDVGWLSKVAKYTDVVIKILRDWRHSHLLWVFLLLFASGLGSHTMCCQATHARRIRDSIQPCPHRFAWLGASICPTSSLELLQQPRSVPQLAPKQPCVLPAHLLFIAFSARLSPTMEWVKVTSFGLSEPVSKIYLHPAPVVSPQTPVSGAVRFLTHSQVSTSCASPTRTRCPSSYASSQ